MPPGIPSVPRRDLLTGGAVGVSTLILPTALAAASPGGVNLSEPQSQEQTFAAGGSFQVPAGVTSIEVVAEGTAGGLGTESFVGDTNTTPGATTYQTISTRRGAAGTGSAVTASITVTPGETLDVVLGDSAAAVTLTLAMDGIAGGVPIAGGAGGRAVGLRRGSTWLVVAGGGGGGGIGGFSYNSGDNGEITGITLRDGGAGGGAGAPATAGTAGTGSSGGGGATTSAAGAGGTGASTGPFNGNGTAGSAFTGTALGAGGRSSTSFTLLGGAGGSGYYGGGGGGSGGGTDQSGAGGGGGSTYVASEATLASVVASTRSLDDGPLLTLRYTA